MHFSLLFFPLVFQKVCWAGLSEGLWLFGGLPREYLDLSLCLSLYSITF